MSRTVENVREIISKLDIVEEIGQLGNMKQSGKSIPLANLPAGDEFLKYFFRSAPAMYMYLKQITTGKVSEDVIDDARSFIFQFENLAKENLEGSKLLELLEEK